MTGFRPVDGARSSSPDALQGKFDGLLAYGARLKNLCVTFRVLNMQTSVQFTEMCSA
jgi:hypothetical protein